MKPGFAYQLRRGSLPLRIRLVNGLPRRSFTNHKWFVKRRLVEAAGVEPASDNIPQRRLHTWPEFWFRLSRPLQAGFLEGYLVKMFRLIRNKQPLEAILLVDALPRVRRKTRQDASRY